MFVVVWEPKHGRGGGHQMTLEQGKAEYIRRRLSKEMPDVDIRIDTAEAYGAAAVLERGQRRQSREQGVR